MIYKPGDELIGGFDPNDGTIDFYLRVRSLMPRDAVVLDLGAGRGAWYEDDGCETRRRTRHLRADCDRLIAADIDEAVRDNRSADETALIGADGRLPLEDDSIDVVVADFVIEHVKDVERFETELHRVLKPGGWFCARTPHVLNYVALGSRLFEGALESRLLSMLQPDRKEADVFPKVYALNSARRLRSGFGRWDSTVQIFRANPAYYGGRRSIYRTIDFLSRLMPAPLIGVIFFFAKQGER